MKTKPQSSRSAKKNPSAPQGPAKTKIKKAKKIKSSQASVGLADDGKPARRKKSVFRRLLSWSIVGYLGYYFFYGCASPFDITQAKPAICEPIDTLKLDLLYLVESSYFKANVNPYIIEPLKKHYQQYGLPIQEKTQAIYNNYGEKGKHIFYQSVAPKVNDLLSQPFIQEKKVHAYNVYTDKLNPWLEEIQKQYQITQSTVTKKYHELPPSVLEKIDRLIDLYDKAERTELKPILIKYYWILLDQFELLVLHNQYIEQLKAWIDQQEQIQAYRQQLSRHYQQYIQPNIVLLNQKFHLDQLLQSILSLLPQRDTPPRETIGSPIIETKTPEKAHKTIDIPITSSIPKAIESVIDHITKPISAKPTDVSKAFESIKDKFKHSSSTSRTATKAFDSLKDKIRNIHIKDFENDHISDSTERIHSTEPVILFNQDKVDEQVISLEASVDDVNIEKTPQTPVVQEEKEEHVIIDPVVQENKEKDILIEQLQHEEQKNILINHLQQEEQEQNIIEQLEQEEQEQILIEQLKQEEQIDILTEQLEREKDEGVLIEQLEQEKENEQVDEIKHDNIEIQHPATERDKGIVEVPDERELFEVHKKEPQSPLTKEDSQEAPIVLDDVIIIEDQVIIPPLPAETKAVPEEPVDPEEEVILL